MKKFLLALALTFSLCLVSHAEDKTFFGAYWVTSPKSKLYAGPLEVTVYNIGNVAGIGNVTVRASDDEGKNYEWHWQWAISRNGKTITFTTLDTGSTAVWKGKLSILTGNMTGTWKGLAGAKGKFQATPKLFSEVSE